ncbi:hypothetical protein DFH06DRAFT_1147882 [Mycena polygramma]|nr:hypothetical protein DFH06DRAFT_1147882 [Mycena polygramma]
MSATYIPFRVNFIDDNTDDVESLTAISPYGGVVAHIGFHNSAPPMLPADDQSHNWAIGVAANGRVSQDHTFSYKLVPMRRGYRGRQLSTTHADIKYQLSHFHDSYHRHQVQHRANWSLVAYYTVEPHPARTHTVHISTNIVNNARLGSDHDKGQPRIRRAPTLRRKVEGDSSGLMEGFGTGIIIALSAAARVPFSVPDCHYGAMGARFAQGCQLKDEVKRYIPEQFLARHWMSKAWLPRNSQDHMNV